MKKGHGSSRRQAYGRRMKDLRSRPAGSLEIDLEGPAEWSRGDAWDDERPLHRASLRTNVSGVSPRPR